MSSPGRNSDLPACAARIFSLMVMAISFTFHTNANDPHPHQEVKAGSRMSRLILGAFAHKRSALPDSVCLPAFRSAVTLQKVLERAGDHVGQEEGKHHGTWAHRHHGHEHDHEEQDRQRFGLHKLQDL